MDSYWREGRGVKRKDIDGIEIERDIIERDRIEIDRIERDRIDEIEIEEGDGNIYLWNRVIRN